MKREAAALAALLILAAGCGGAEESRDTGASQPGEPEYTLPEADVYLTVTDSIGVELGDSNYVFGRIAGADITPDGMIAVLDMQKTCVSLFTPEGDFHMRLGRKGSGPGEFLLPSAMAFFPRGAEGSMEDGPVPGMVVCDVMGGKLAYFDAGLEFIREVHGFFPSPPAVLGAVDGGAVVGMKPEFLQNERGMFMGFTIARWEMGETEPSVVYFESMSPFDPTDLSGMQDDIVSFGTSDEGLVLTAPISTDSYGFTLWSPGGDELFTVERDFERVRKTRSEIELEREIVNTMMVQQGMPESMANWEPDPYREAISGLWFDGSDRIWVARGTFSTPTFDVYDLEGELLFTVALDAGERASTWQVIVAKDSFLAFEANPDLFPRLFIGELPAPSAGD